MDLAVDLVLIIYLHAVVAFGVYICRQAFDRLRGRITALELRRPDHAERFEEMVVSAAENFDADQQPASGVLGLVPTSSIDRAAPTTVFSTPEN